MIVDNHAGGCGRRAAQGVTRRIDAGGRREQDALARALTASIEPCGPKGIDRVRPRRFVTWIIPSRCAPLLQGSSSQLAATCGAISVAT